MSRLAKLLVLGLVVLPVLLAVILPNFFYKAVPAYEVVAAPGTTQWVSGPPQRGAPNGMVLVKRFSFLPGPALKRLTDSCTSCANGNHARCRFRYYVIPLVEERRRNEAYQCGCDSALHDEPCRHCTAGHHSHCVANNKLRCICSLAQHPKKPSTKVSGK